MRCVQLTDPHLFARDDRRLRGVPTNASFEDVLSKVTETMSDPDLCIVTGDLAQDEKRATYDRLRRSLSRFEGRFRVVPGNHDQPDAVREVFGDLLDDNAPTASFVELREDVTVVGLDSHVPGEVGGELGSEQLRWMISVVPPDKPLLVCVHHPPIGSGTRWLDAMSLRDGARLIDRLQRYDTEVVVVHGHTHQESHRRAGRVEIYGTPSTAFQFATGGRRGETDHVAPGFRVIEYDAQGFRTEVVRLPTLQYPPIPQPGS